MSRTNNKGNGDYVHDTYYNVAAVAGRYNENSTPQNNLARNHVLYNTFLTELCMNRFEWSGLPDTVNPRYLEMTLFRHGSSIFYQDMQLGGKFLALRGMPIGSPNYEDEYPEFQVIGNGGAFVPRTLSAFPRRVPHMVGGEQLYTREPAECVPIYANFLRRGEMLIVDTFASRLAELDHSLDINAKNLRHPKLITSDYDTKLTADNINRQHDLGAEWIHVVAQAGGQLPGVLPQVLDVGGDPDAVDALINLRDRVYASCMMFLGINNGPAEKQERVQEAEVDANNEQVASGRHIALNARREAARRINERWGLDISVDYRVRNEQRADDQREAELGIEGGGLVAGPSAVHEEGVQ